MSSTNAPTALLAAPDSKSAASLWPAVRRDLETLGNDVSRLAETALEAGQEKVVAEAIQLKSGIAALSGRVNAQVKSGATEAQSYVVSRPVLSIAVAFGAGMLVAIMAGRRR